MVLEILPVFSKNEHGVIYSLRNLFWDCDDTLFEVRCLYIISVS